MADTTEITTEENTPFSTVADATEIDTEEKTPPSTAVDATEIATVEKTPSSIAADAKKIDTEEKIPSDAVVDTTESSAEEKIPSSTEICSEDDIPFGTSSTKHVFSAPECKIVGVIVYQGRAEITRKFTVNVVQGMNKVTVKGLTRLMELDSIRVEGIGAATITEVTTQLSQEDVTKLLKESDEKKELLRKQMATLVAKRNRFERQKSVLDGLADSLKSASPMSKKKDGDLQRFLDSTVLGNLSNFFEFHLKQATDLDDNIRQIEDQLQTTRKEILEYQDMNQEPGAELSIFLVAKEAGEMTLAFSYVTSYGAWWNPKYDIWVFSEEKKMKIQYYAMVNQATEEDWKDAKISLSTAMPYFDRTVPTLGSMRLKAKRSPVHMLDKYIRAEMDELRDEVLEMADSIDNTVMTTFEVARKTTIPSGKSKHKVTIGMFDLEPSFDYQTAPKKDINTFVNAKVKNTSKYALLAGSANIFLDNKFIAKSHFKAVSPAEEFVCSLGVDPAVQVTYEPIHKDEDQSGTSANPVVRTTYYQDIKVKNTHAVPINITVKEQLPRSSDDRIKTYLVEPVIRNRKEYESDHAVRNNNDNIEWNLVLDADATKDLLLKYIVEYPVGEEIDVSYTSL